MDPLEMELVVVLFFLHIVVLLLVPGGTGGVAVCRSRGFLQPTCEFEQLRPIFFLGGASRSDFFIERRQLASQNVPLANLLFLLLLLIFGLLLGGVGLLAKALTGLRREGLPQKARETAGEGGGGRLRRLLALDSVKGLLNDGLLRLVLPRR